MNLSFSTNRWENISFRDFMDHAVKYRFSGIEIHNVSAIENEDLRRLYRSLIERKLVISCIDATHSVGEDDGAEAKECIEAASALHCPYVRIKADIGEKCIKIIEELIDVAKSAKVVLLVETAGDLAYT